MAFQTCYLHIGTEKTGTTSLQSFLAANRDGLAQQGYYVPTCFGTPNHVGLAIYAGTDALVSDLVSGVGIAMREVSTYRHRIREVFRTEITDRAGSSPRHLVLSNEHLHSRLRTVEEIAALRDLLAEFCENIRVIVYLRRQDRMAVSLASTRAIKGGTVYGEVFETALKQVKNYYHYDILLQNFAEIFGDDALDVRIFERERLLDQDLYADFCSALGIEDSQTLRRPKSRNESLTGFGQRLLAELNKYFPDDPDPIKRRERTELVRAVTTFYTGRSQLVTRGEAEAFYGRFIDGNRWVKETFFPNMVEHSLFDESFVEYPDTREDESPDFAEACAAAAKLWSWQADRLRRLAEQARKQQKAREQDDSDISLLVRSLRASGGSPSTIDPHACARIGQALLRAGRAAMARDWAKLAGEAHPDSLDVALLVGEVAAADQDWARALVHYRHASELAPQRAGVRYHLSVALSHTGPIDAALKEAEAAAELAPANNVMRTWLAQLQQRGSAS